MQALPPTDDISVGSFWIAKRTQPYFFQTKNGQSKNAEWLIIEGVPCKVMEVKEDLVLMNAFTSAMDRQFAVEKNQMNELFVKASLEKECILAPKYPFPIPTGEFDHRKKVSELEKSLDEMLKNPACDPLVKKIINDKLFQMIQSQGSPYITMSDYEQYKQGKITLTAHKRFGCPIFNRNCRWCPPIDITYDEFAKSPSYPAPLGIRPKDFCLPSELYSTMVEMLTQIYNMQNIDKKSFVPLQKTLALEERKPHCCKYCGECIDAKDYSSVYKSETNFMEICHRDPNDRYLPHNMYWGHGDCNRKQGGYSEEQRKYDGVRLMFLNGDITEELYQQLLRSIKSR